MKELFSNEKKSLLWLWLLVHLGIPALLLLSFFFAAPLRLNTLLLDMLPQPAQARGAAEADRILGERSGREAIILAAAQDFEDAKKGAVLLYAEFENSPMVESLSLYFDHSVIEQFAAFFHNYRFVIAGRETINLLETGGAGEIALDSLALAFGAFTFLPLDNIDKDPFLLAERRMQEFLSSPLLGTGNLVPKDDVLAAEIDGIWYVMLRMTLTPQAVSLDRDRNAVMEIYAVASHIEETVPGLEIYFSGIPFHSYESSSNAQREISFISTVMLFVILALFIFVFRSPLPVLSSLLAVIISLTMAAATALLVFREIHILTFVFGTTLIGIGVDYSVHFFIHWKGNPALKDGYAIRSHISKSMIVCFISSQICFFVFLFAPFPILRQFAVFSMAGLLSSFLTSYCLYPLLKVPDDKKRILRFLTTNQHEPTRTTEKHDGTGSWCLCGSWLKKYIRLLLFATLAIAALGVIVFSRGVKIHNDITSLYTMSTFMLESEKRAAMVLDQGSAPWYFIVSGDTPNETLENEQTLLLRLEEEISRGNLASFLGTSVFVPSETRQRETYEAMKALLPLAGAQYEYLGFPPEYAAVFFGEFAAGERFCLPEHAPQSAGISNLWIGEAGGKFYSCVLLFHPENEETFRAVAGEFDFVHFINKAQDIGRDLDTLTRTMAFIFLAAFIAISVLMFFVYPMRDSLRICAVPLFLVLSTLAVLTAAKIPLGFFSAAALVLVFGLGLDFIIYMSGRKAKSSNNPTSLAVLISYLTSLLSFGALGLSSFVPVHIFGLTVSVGLSAAFISTMLLAGKRE